jgi:hypothetical protein
MHARPLDMGMFFPAIVVKRERNMERRSGRK